MANPPETMAIKLADIVKYICTLSIVNTANNAVNKLIVELTAAPTGCEFWFSILLGFGIHDSISMPL
jgi:hypothetical protein